jgi:hypothetical protein
LLWYKAGRERAEGGQEHDAEEDTNLGLIGRKWQDRENYILRIYKLL